MDHDRDGRSAGVEVLRDLALRRRQIDDVEAAGRHEMRDEAAARLTVIEVEHRSRHMIDREGRRIAEHDHLNQQRHDQAEHRPTVAA